MATLLSEHMLDKDGEPTMTRVYAPVSFPGFWNLGFVYFFIAHPKIYKEVKEEMEKCPMPT